MHEAMTDDTPESIPRAPEWYQRIPFDPSLVAFRDEQGNEKRYMISALDEHYQEEPGDCIALGAIPPEEREVRDHLTVAILARHQVSGFEFWWSQVIRPTERYRMVLSHFQSLHDLCRRSPEHRAAICRIANSPMTRPILKRELRRIVDMTDASLRIEATPVQSMD